MEGKSSNYAFPLHDGTGFGENNSVRKQASFIPFPTITRDNVTKFRQYQISHDIALRDQLACENLPLVYKIARRYSTYGEPIEDLIQEGSIGLLHAIDHFDPEQGVQFSSYAVHLITSQIQHYLRDCGHLIRQPAWVQELNSKVVRATKQLEQQLGREPSLTEIADHLNLTEDSVREVLAARRLKHVVSLTSSTGNQENNELLLIDKTKIQAKRHVTLSLPFEDRIVLEETITRLKIIEQHVVRLFFFAELNQSEIAHKLGISPHYSSYLLHRSINKIRSNMTQQNQDKHSIIGEIARPVDTISLPTPIYDRYTGLYSEVYLRYKTVEAIEQCFPQTPGFAVMLTQISGLEGESNEKHLLLAAIGQQFQRLLHASDLIAYLGGEQFAFLLYGVGEYEAKRIGERLREQLIIDYPVQVMLHHGYALFPLQAANSDELFLMAEQALKQQLVEAGAGNTKKARRRKL